MMCIANHHPFSTSSFAADGAAKKEVPLQHLIEAIEVDTTPRKSMVAKILGGEFTFLGQYEEEGTMIMIRRPDWHEWEAASPGREGRPSTGERVVVDEERNETEEIPCRPEREVEEEDSDEDEDVEDVSDLVVTSLKRQAQDVADGHGNKRARVDGENSGGSGDGTENEEP